MKLRRLLPYFLCITVHTAAFAGLQVAHNKAWRAAVGFPVFWVAELLDIGEHMDAPMILCFLPYALLLFSPLLAHVVWRKRWLIVLQVILLGAHVVGFLMWGNYVSGLLPVHD